MKVLEGRGVARLFSQGAMCFPGGASAGGLQGGLGVQPPVRSRGGDPAGG